MTVPWKGAHNRRRSEMGRGVLSPTESSAKNNVPVSVSLRAVLLKRAMPTELIRQLPDSPITATCECRQCDCNVRPSKDKHTTVSHYTTSQRNSRTSCAYSPVLVSVPSDGTYSVALLTQFVDAG